MIKLFQSMRDKILNEDLDMGKTLGKVDMNKTPDAGQGGKPEDSAPDTINNPTEQNEEELDNGIKNGEKVYLGNTYDEHYYIISKDDDLVVADAAGKVLMSAKDKLGDEFDVKDNDQQIEFLKLVAGELKPNISFGALERFDFFKPSEQEDTTMGEAPAMAPNGEQLSTGGANPATLPNMSSTEQTVSPEPPKPDYDPITKEKDATGLDQLNIEGQESLGAATSTTGAGEATDVPPLEEELPGQGKEEDLFGEEESIQYPDKEALSGKSGDNTLNKGRTPNPAFKGNRMSESQDGAKCLNCKGMGKIEDVTCVECSGTGGIYESLSESNIQVLYQGDLGSLNDTYQSEGGTEDIEDAVNKYDPKALQIVRQTIEGELYYEGINASVKSVELQLPSGKFYSNGANFNVTLEVLDEESMQNLENPDSPFQIIGGDKMADSLMAKHGVTEAKSKVDTEDTDRKKTIGTMVKEVMRGLSPDKDYSRKELSDECDLITKHSDNPDVRYAVLVRVCKKFRRKPKEVKETGDSESMKTASEKSGGFYEDGLEEKIQELQIKYLGT